MRPSLIFSLALALLAAIESACAKKHVAHPPMTPPPAAATGSASGKSNENATEAITPPPPPVIQAPVTPPQDAPIPEPEQLPPPPPPQRRPRPTPTPPPATAPQLPQAPAPQIGPVLTADEQREGNAAVDRDIQSALNSLRSVANRRLSKRQQADRDQIQNFIQQAQASRASDLPAARRLAEKAALLADTLARSF